MNTILVHAGFWYAFPHAKAGDVFHLFLHELRWPAQLRSAPPRVRLLEDGHPGFVRCELLDPWPDAPSHYPPEWAPGARPSPGSLWGECPHSDDIRTTR